MKKLRTAVTISMPQDMAEDYDKLARRLAKNRSVLFREMFLTYKRQAMKKEFRENERPRRKQRGIVFSTGPSFRAGHSLPRT